MYKDRKQRLKKDGIFCGIIERRVRGQDELTATQKQHNAIDFALAAIAYNFKRSLSLRA